MFAVFAGDKYDYALGAWACVGVFNTTLFEVKEWCKTERQLTFSRLSERSTPTLGDKSIIELYDTIQIAEIIEGKMYARLQSYGFDEWVAIDDDGQRAHRA